MSPLERPTLASEILARAREAPERAAFHFYDASNACEVISRSDLIRRSLDWTRAYRGAGLVEGDIVIVVIDHRPDLLFAYLGAILGGFTPSFMPYSTAKQDAALFADAHRRLFDRIGARVVAVTQGWIEGNGTVLGDGTFKLLIAEAVVREVASMESEPIAMVGAHETALLQHSSGTTSLKKGVALSHAAILNQMCAYRAAIGLSRQDVVASWLPLYHDMGLMACWLLPLTSGVPVAQMDPFTWAREPWRLFEMIERHRATLVWQPNFAYQHLARMVDEQVRYDLSSLRALVNCSEPCKPETIRGFLARFEREGLREGCLQACYAMAENCFAVTQTPVGRPPGTVLADALVLSSEGRLASPRGPEDRVIELMSVGSPVQEVQVRIVDSARRPLDDGLVGEIVIRGASLFSGYFRLPDETTRTMADGWHHTGDLGLIVEGELYVTGRLKDLIIVRGRNFYAHDVEQVVSSCSGVKPGRVAAFGLYAETLGSEEAIIVAEVQGIEDLDAVHRRKRSAEVKQAVEEALGLTPRTVHLVEPGWLIKTTSGKVSREANLAKYLTATSLQAGS